MRTADSLRTAPSAKMAAVLLSGSGLGRLFAKSEVGLNWTLSEVGLNWTLSEVVGRPETRELPKRFGSGWCSF